MPSRLELGAVLLAMTAAGCGDSRAAPPPGPVSDESPVASASSVAQVAAPPRETIVISAVGDCTLGSNWDIPRAPGSFHVELETRGDDYRYPFSGVLAVLGSDDLTIANLETTLTERNPATVAPFSFKGKPEYARILREGSVDVVSVANNHSHDAGVPGYEDTLASVRGAGVGPFGNGIADVRRLKGIEIVNLGYLGGLPRTRQNVERDVAKHKRDDNIVIVSFHWGIEGWNTVAPEQKHLGHAALDAGADLVLGHHPHVLQGIEERGGRRIVYSLGNFVFGGHSKPADMDSIIYQEVLSVENGRVVERSHRVHAVRISTARDHNDYRPVLLDGAERERVEARLAGFSAELSQRR